MKLSALQIQFLFYEPILSALFYFNFSPRAPNNPMKASESSTHIYIHVAPGAIHHKNTSRTSRSSSLIQKKKIISRRTISHTHTHARAQSSAFFTSSGPSSTFRGCPLQSIPRFTTLPALYTDRYTHTREWKGPPALSSAHT